jgi:hypothetical protein
MIVVDWSECICAKCFDKSADVIEITIACGEKDILELVFGGLSSHSRDEKSIFS